MSTHTAGPWQKLTTPCLDDAPIATLHLDWCIWSGGGQRGTTIAHVPMVDGEILRSEANARLIAAAPDLLEAAYKAAGALQAFFGLLDAELLGNPQQLLTQDAKKISADALEVCRAAISKATGEQS